VIVRAATFVHTPGWALLDHDIRTGEDRQRDRDTQHFRALQVDDELVFCRQLDRDVAGIGAFEDLVDMCRDTAVHVQTLGNLGNTGLYRWTSISWSKRYDAARLIRLASPA